MKISVQRQRDACLDFAAQFLDDAVGGEVADGQNGGVVVVVEPDLGRQRPQAAGPARRGGGGPPASPRRTPTVRETRPASPADVDIEPS